jgi:hypothetical protein
MYKVTVHLLFIITPPF